MNAPEKLVPLQTTWMRDALSWFTGPHGDTPPVVQAFEPSVDVLPAIAEVPADPKAP